MKFRRRHRLFDIQDYEPGATVFKEGDTGDCVYFVREGAVEVVKGDQVVATLKVGQYFGEMALLSDERRNATVRAAGQAKLAVLGKQNFLTMMRVVPSTEEDVLATIQARAMKSTGE